MGKDDKIQGILFGGAIGDTLGMGTEFMSREEVLKHYQIFSIWR